MADIFFTEDARRLLKDKYIIMLGDSNTRGIYKDLVTLLTQNTVILQSALKRKREDTYLGDKLGNHSELGRGRDYVEERSFNKFNVKLEFYFLNRCYTPRIIDLLENIQLGVDNQEIPDVIYINSTLWDMSRWGPNGPTEFKDNMNKLARLFKTSLPESTLVIWATALPVSPDIRSSILLKQTRILESILRFDVMEANSFARQVMAANGFDVIDLHFHMRMQIHRRIPDGIHYMPEAIRFLTNLILTHVALAWDFPLPNRVQTILLDKAKAEVSVKPDSQTQKQLENLEKIAENPAKNEEAKATSKELQESRPNLMKELCSKKQNKSKGKKKRGAYNRELRQRGNPYKAEVNVVTSWESGKEQISDTPDFSQGINFSDEPCINSTFSEESRSQDRQIPRFQNSSREFDGQFQNGRFGSSRFRMDVFEARSQIAAYSETRFRDQLMFSSNMYRPEPFQNNRYQDQRYTTESGYENSIPPFGRNPRRYGNGFYRGNEYEAEPPNHRQLLSTMVRSSRYAPY